MPATAFVSVLVVLIAAVAIWAAYRMGATRGRLEVQAQLAAAQAQVQGMREQLEGYRAIEEGENETIAALGPLTSTLARVAQQVDTLERDRSTQFGQLGERLREVSQATSGLQSETATLAGALKSSNIRGVWGENQLRRVLELSGLERWSDFDDQVSSTNSRGETVRPDVVVHLPGEKSLVIDAKAPLSAFMAAQNSDISDAERSEYLHTHGDHLRKHVRTLAAKEYWTAFANTPEMVVCFVPGDAILAAALDAQPGLYDEAMASKVILASPATLLALARTVAHVWKQDSLTRNARELLALGTQLHSRIRTLGTHLTAVGGSLTASVANYNKLVATLETRVLVTARKFGDLGITGDDVDEVRPLESTARPLTAPELMDGIDEAPREVG